MCTLQDNKSVLITVDVPFFAVVLYYIGTKTESKNSYFDEFYFRPSSAESNKQARTSPREDLPTFSKSSNRRRAASENSYSDQSLSDQSLDMSRDKSDQSMNDNRNINAKSPVSMETHSTKKPLSSSPHTMDVNFDQRSKRTENGITNLEKSSTKSLSSTSINSEEEFKDAVDAKVATFFSVMSPR